jgi:3-methyladenine DNA glycosylase AlkD
MNRLESLKPLFEANTDANKAIGMAAYMRNKFTFLGLSTTLRRELSKQWRKELLQTSPHEIIETCKTLWNEPCREYQYVALDVLHVFIKKATEDFAPHIEWFVTQKPWWDTVDILSTTVAGTYMRRFPHVKNTLAREWNNHPSFWMNRCAILYQLKYKETIDDDWLRECLLTHSHSKEFFIQKAIGWMLREYAKTNPEAVYALIESIALKPLSVREATKHIGKRV